MKKKKAIKIKDVTISIPIFIVLVILALLVLVPIIWMTLSAFKPEKEIIFIPEHSHRVQVWDTLLPCP